MHAYESFWVDVIDSWNYVHAFTVGLVLFFITLMCCIQYRYRISDEGITPDPTLRETNRHFKQQRELFQDLLAMRLDYDKKK